MTTGTSKMYGDRELSENFKLSEFGGVWPCYKLLHILKGVRKITGQPVIITSGPRTIEDHVKKYIDLSEKKLIKTKENGLSDVPLIDYIPWSSRHLPSHSTSRLLAVDFKCLNSVKNYMSGDEIYNMVISIVDSTSYKKWLEESKNPTFDQLGLGRIETDEIGVGIGKEYIHLDTSRVVRTTWRYEY